MREVLCTGIADYGSRNSLDAMKRYSEVRAFIVFNQRNMSKYASGEKSRVSEIEA